MKNVVIVTQKLGANYGGILQAYAMQHSLRSHNYNPSTASSLKRSIKRALLKNVYTKRMIEVVTGRKYNQHSSNAITAETDKFIKSRIYTTTLSETVIAMREGAIHGLVVGSDQVWRSRYADVSGNMFDFASKIDITKISYAASFGKDNLKEYGPALIKKTKKLAQKFNAISVREDSGVGIVKEHWGLEAEHHVDPTLLVDAAQYSELIDNPTSELYAPDGDLFSYVLDTDESKQGIADTVAASRGLKVFTVIDGDENGGKPMPPVEQWLRSFRDAKYIVTDSFHGTVFSIIFNKPFIAIGNKERGLARFTSLLKMFGLEDRLVTSADEVTDELINKPIDWDAVNAKVKAEQARSFEYLKRHLG